LPFALYTHYKYKRQQWYSIILVLASSKTKKIIMEVSDSTTDHSLLVYITNNTPSIQYNGAILRDDDYYSYTTTAATSCCGDEGCSQLVVPMMSPLPSTGDNNGEIVTNHKLYNEHTIQQETINDNITTDHSGVSIGENEKYH
jgi:hypothetical protein